MTGGSDVEFHEKLQELRKSKGLTQEELAEDLYVSRTAISKWESGRGYPNIDSLKEISKYFSVSIDDLLSGEKLLTIAEKENKFYIRGICNLLSGIVDICFFILIVLPLYPKTMDGYIYSVNLLAYTETTTLNLLIYWILFVSLTVVGVLKVLMTKWKPETNQKTLTNLSVILNIVLIVFLAMAREAYAVVISFLLLVIKTIIIQEGRMSK